VVESRPAGVKAIVALSVALAIAALLYAALIGADWAPLSSGAWLLGGGLEQTGPVAFLLYAAMLLLIAAGLWKRWSWARRVGVLIAAAGVVLAVPAISSAVMDSRVLAIAREGMQIIVRVVIVFYLTQEPVKEWFAGR